MKLPLLCITKDKMDIEIFKNFTDQKENNTFRLKSIYINIYIQD